jgi:hypothetical protein
MSIDAIKYLPMIAWRGRVKNVRLLTDTTYQLDIYPSDTNEPGAATREIGNYFKDNIGNTYSIIDSDSVSITISDDFALGIGPQTGYYGVVYKSVGNGDSPYLAPVYYRHLDRVALEYSRRFELDILWKNSPKAGHGTLVAGETKIEFSNAFNENEEYELWLYTFNDSGYQVGHTLKLEELDGFTVEVPIDCNYKYIATLTQ